MNRDSQRERNGLPPDWKDISVGELTVRTKQRDPRGNPTTSFRYVDVSSVSNSSFRIIETTELLGADAPSRARKEICVDDVLFATVRPTLKRVALVPSELNGEIASTGFIVLRADRSQVEPRYLYSRLLTDEFIKRMGELERGASYPAVRDSDVLNEVIPVPGLPEQQRIAAVLDLMQRAMEQQERLLALSAELKRALLHQLFTHGLSQEPQKQTEIGLIPQSWKTSTMEEAGEVVYGIQAAVASNLKPIGTKILTNKNLTLDGAFDLEKMNYFELKTARHKATLLRKGDLLFNWRSGSKEHVGKTALFDLDGEYTHSSFILRIRPCDTVTARFLFYFLNYLRASGYFIKRHAFAVNAKFNKSAINQLMVAFPEAKEKAEIVKVLDTAAAKQNLHRRKHAALSTLFRTLLQELMTARIRVKSLDLSAIEMSTTD